MHTRCPGLMLQGAVSTPLNAHSKVSASTQVSASGQGGFRLQFSGNSQFHGSCSAALVLLHLTACLANKLRAREVPHEPHAQSAEASGEYRGRLL